ncbi:hypothetical protein KC950_01870 [Candidatus Saccharibacteria bacterium]|nr:hypothetical protein [Candidatus Saccharibacteria bacterium]
MLVLGKQLEGKNILSLRIGRPVGVATQPIINPNNLKIEGWHAIDSSKKDERIMLSQDVRDILPQGFVVNDHDALTPEDELIRLKDQLNQNFTLVGKIVVSDGRKKLGKVADYAFEKNSMFIQKLYVAQSVVKSFSGGTLIIDRSQIIEITNKRITVKEPTVKEAEAVPVTA